MDKWEEKRQEIIAASFGECANCGAREDSLSVHHRYYETGKAAWDYPNESLIALCKSCHGKADELRRKLCRAIGLLTDADSMQALGYMHALAADNRDQEFVEILSWEHAHGVAQLFGLTADDIPQEHWKARRIPLRWLRLSSTFRHHRIQALGGLG